ncbi:MAG: metallophosphoesterase [Pseudomonadota bacterium]
MLIQYASDLHLEFLERRYSDARLIEPAPGAEVLILAGDIHHADRAVEVFGDWPCPVIYVAGNHESYGTDILKVHARIRESILARSGGQAFHFLENDAVVIGGVRFLGATLWTDYKLMDDRFTQAASMRNAKVGLNDHRMITLGGERFDPADALSLHWGSRTWLAQQLDKKVDSTLDGFDTTVVVTHHGCHPQSCHPRYAGDPMNPAFVSNLRDLVVRADFWVHGHVHDSFDYAVGACRVMANPAGYVRNLGSALGPWEFQQENPGFDSLKVFDTRQRDTLAGDASDAKEDS